MHKKQYLCTGFLINPFLMPKILTEITPLTPDDCLFIRSNEKDHFDFPLHRHAEIELNFVENCEGCCRIVGDSTETLGKYDLVLINSNLEHTWESPKGQLQPMHEITIQWSPTLISQELMATRIFMSIKSLMKNADRGVAFGQSTIMRVFGQVCELEKAEPGFQRFIRLLELLHALGESKDYHVLASSSYARTVSDTDSRKLGKVLNYIDNHYKEDIRLPQMAEMADLSPTSFSKFFTRHTHVSFTDYVVEKRIGFAAHQLIYTDNTISEISYDSGFQTPSNFNRLFLSRKGCTPSQFRESYRLRLIGGHILIDSEGDTFKTTKPERK